MIQATSKTKPEAPTKVLIGRLLSIPQFAKLVGMSRQAAWLWLRKLDEESMHTLLSDKSAKRVGKKRPRWAVSVAKLAMIRPDLFPKVEERIEHAEMPVAGRWVERAGRSALPQVGT